MTAVLIIRTDTAHGAAGDLLYQDCLSGSTGQGGPQPCSPAGLQVLLGNNSGLDRAWAVAVSPDGASLYALAQNDDAIVRFSRNTSTGALTYQDCITGETASGSMGIGGSDACTEIPSHKPGGANSGLDEPYGIVISADGTSVYVGAQNDDSIAHFQRNTGTGVLTYVGCTTGETASASTANGGNDSCLGLDPNQAVNGADTGLDKVRSLAIDSDGETVYALAPQDDAISIFTRNSGTGVLTTSTCFTAENATGSLGLSNCNDLPGISAFGTNSGLDNPQAVTLSPNDASVYVASGNDASITRFDRTDMSGDLTYRGCLTRDSSVPDPMLPDTCAQIAGATANGINSGLDNLRAVVVSPGGDSVYAAAGNDASVINFSRNMGTGALAFQDCITGDSMVGPAGNMNCGTAVASATADGINSGWDVGVSITPALAVSPNGAGVYFGAQDDDSVVQLDRNTGTGALSFRRCLTAETASVTVANAVCAGQNNMSDGENSALDEVSSLALSSDGSSVYIAAPNSDAVTRFSFEPAATPPVVNPPVLTPTSTPVPKKCKKGRKLKKGKCVKKKRKKRKK